jgi:hypothetical protein
LADGSASSSGEAKCYAGVVTIISSGWDLQWPECISSVF